MGVENFCTKLPKGTFYAKSVEQIIWRMCSDVVLTLYGGEEKKYARIAIGKSMSSITLRRYRAVVIIVIC